MLGWRRLEGAARLQCAHLCTGRLCLAPSSPPLPDHPLVACRDPPLLGRPETLFSWPEVGPCRGLAAFGPRAPRSATPAAKRLPQRPGGQCGGLPTAMIKDQRRSRRRSLTTTGAPARPSASCRRCPPAARAAGPCRPVAACLLELVSAAGLVCRADDEDYDVAADEDGAQPAAACQTAMPGRATRPGQLSHCQPSTPVVSPQCY